MSKEEAGVTTQTTPADENDQFEVVSIDDRFWRHKSALVWCSIACVGGFQLGIKHHPVAKTHSQSKTSLLLPRS